MFPSELQEKLVKYMNAATDLAEQMRADLKQGDEYTNETVLKLSEFKLHAEKLQSFVDMLETNMRNYN
jgi:hypothetical protein